MKKIGIEKRTLLSLLFNLAYAVSNCVMGFVMHTWWFITVGAYYVVLSVTRFSVLQVKKHAAKDEELEVFARKITGILFIFLAISLVGVVVLTVINDRSKVHHEIIMIAIATYTFIKVIMAIINLAKIKNVTSLVIKTLRNISLADAFVSVFSLQRSMLVSFEGLTANEITIFNLITGSAVCIFIFLLGLNLIGGKRTIMAKSKIVKLGTKIGEGVVEGYQKIEEGVVKGYTKIEDKFIDQYLTKDGETVEQAKKRLKEQTK